MSNIGQRPTSEASVDPTTRHNLSRHSPSVAVGAASQPMPARLQVIHDLIRSGDYHVPATVIADRMIEQMIEEKREGKS
jgi:anti-sigma28 factor (negative regulator of flagellin synthesis)